MYDEPARFRVEAAERGHGLLNQGRHVSLADDIAAGGNRLVPLCDERVCRRAHGRLVDV
jgi:hypothetical protein